MSEMSNQEKAKQSTSPFNLAEAREALEIHTMCSAHIDAALEKLKNAPDSERRARALKDIKSRFMDKWDINYHGGKMFVLQGESGVAKTALIRQMCQYGPLTPREIEDHGGLPWMELKMQGSGGEEEESEMGAFNQSSQSADGDTHSFSVPGHSFPTGAPKSISGLGILFHDELFTKRPMQQNNLSLLISHGYKEGRWGHKIPPGWIHVGATNPVNSSYHLSQAFDKRLMDRCWIIDVHPDPKELMTYFSQSGLLPDALYGFLLMNESFLNVDDQHSISPRTWDGIGHFLYQCEIRNLALGRPVSMDIQTRMLVSQLGESVAGAFQQYLAKGDDPALYPIVARELINSTKEEQKEHMKRITTWFKKSETVLLSVTANDVGRWLADSSVQMTDSQLDRACDFIAAISRAPELAQACLDNSIHGGRDAYLHTKLINTDLGKKLNDMVKQDEDDRRSRLSRRS
jgi:hypothetical protein